MEALQFFLTSSLIEDNVLFGKKEKGCCFKQSSVLGPVRDVTMLKPVVESKQCYVYVSFSVTARYS